MKTFFFRNLTVSTQTNDRNSSLWNAQSSSFYGFIMNNVMY